MNDIPTAKSEMTKIVAPLTAGSSKNDFLSVDTVDGYFTPLFHTSPFLEGVRSINLLAFEHVMYSILYYAYQKAVAYWVKKVVTFSVIIQFWLLREEVI